MKRLWIIAALVAGCSRESTTTTATIAPAAPRPAPTATGTLADRPIITTSGSPPPAVRRAPGNERVTIDAHGLAVRRMLPRTQTVFRISDETGSAHELELRGASGTSKVTVPPRGTAILQVTLTDPSYVLACTTRGHTESAELRTYVAGAPLAPR